MINHVLKGIPNSEVDWIQVRAVWGPNLSLDELDVLTTQVYVGVFLAVCDGAPSCRRHPRKMPALLLKDVTVALDNTINTLFLVNFLKTCCYKSRLVFNCCFEDT